MRTLKTAVIVVLLLVVFYGVEVLNRPPDKPPQVAEVGASSMTSTSVLRIRGFGRRPTPRSHRLPRQGAASSFPGVSRPNFEAPPSLEAIPRRPPRCLETTTQPFPRTVRHFRSRGSLTSPPRGSC